MPEHNFALDDLEIGCLEALINMQSFDVQGEINKMELIDSFLNGADVRRILLLLGDGNENHAGRRVLIAEKGSTEPVFTLMFYAHVDVVKPPDEWTNPRFNRRDGKIYGNGAWDMQYAIQQMISLAHTAQVPEGMCVRFVFCPDEEKTSMGIEELIKWPGMNSTDLIISAEIPGPMQLRKPGAPMRFVTKRRGVLKMSGEIWRESRGHGAQGGINAIQEFSQADVLAQRYHRKYLREHGEKHPLLGEDELSETSVLAPRSKFQNTKRKVAFTLNANIVPSTNERSLKDILTVYQTGFETIAKLRHWERKEIKHKLIMTHPSADASYPPYSQNSDHQLFLPVRRAIQNICHPDKEAVEEPGVAWADQNKLVAALYSCIDIFADGANCHDSHEWVREEDIGRIREVFRYCIEEAFLPTIEARRGSV